MAKEKTKRERLGDALLEIDMFDDEDSVFLPSSKVTEEPDPSEKESSDKGDQISDEDWLAAVSQMPKLRLKRKIQGDLFEEVESGKKKRKRKKKDGTTDFQKEFSPEMATLRHLLLDQNEFVSSLQATYNAMSKQKSSARGVGKYQTDLIANITSARNVSASLVKQIIDAKKTIADLSMKERKELGMLSDEDGNLGDQASSFLKQLLNVDRKSLAGEEFNGIDDVEYEEMADYIRDSMMANSEYEERPDEVRKYLKYENMDVSVKVILHSDGTQQFIAVDKDDNVVPDYPLPSNDTELNINRSTMKAKDGFGISYDIILED